MDHEPDGEVVCGVHIHAGSFWLEHIALHAEIRHGADRIHWILAVFVKGVCDHSSCVHDVIQVLQDGWLGGWRARERKYEKARENVKEQLGFAVEMDEGGVGVVLDDDGPLRQLGARNDGEVTHSILAIGSGCRIDCLRWEDTSPRPRSSSFASRDSCGWGDTCRASWFWLFFGFVSRSPIGGGRGSSRSSWCRDIRRHRLGPCCSACDLWRDGDRIGVWKKEASGTGIPFPSLPPCVPSL